MEFGLALMALAIAVAVILAVCAISASVRVVSKPLVREPFLSGMTPSEHAVSRYHVRWYTVAVLFLAFDMEMVFMYPWVLVVGRMGAGAVVEMFTFLAVLFAAVVYAWREGAFRWS
ncbi:NADH-quinone oxidoreductase subunit A [Paenarthrobacter sp. PH39-S1]|uniref:NADH-quinone oxidoreductase subunit A n=1 Tax=Paenarthrobacter sp. PH39-S1 TaxID=3046204 RepID=UPI0024B88ADB|nr:NADH-quinone oxidoreductase subunit A [Paenarthrobacter sp. PH39-S1]MDJ0354575.1 NADH-quinone oxidoreductase subunit A [Paenarthrobacter sp. PH39-S1]